MRIIKLGVVVLATLLISIFSAKQLDRVCQALLLEQDASRAEVIVLASDTRVPAISQGAQRYRLDAGQSKFIAHAMAGGLFWFKGHDHLVAVREFGGEATLTFDSITPASLEIKAKADSLVETSSVFTEAQKQIIDKELREIVLEPSKYPDISFHSTSVTGKASGPKQYDLNISGDLTLHGVTRQIKIPTRVVLTGRDLRATGEFSIDRSDFNVKATSAFHGLVRVKDKVKFTFDIVGHQL
jgi:polyisoprenoid-binding protein YceI